MTRTPKPPMSGADVRKLIAGVILLCLFVAIGVAAWQMHGIGLYVVVLALAAAFVLVLLLAIE